MKSRGPVLRIPRTLLAGVVHFGSKRRFAENAILSMAFTSCRGRGAQSRSRAPIKCAPALVSKHSAPAATSKRLTCVLSLSPPNSDPRLRASTVDSSAFVALPLVLAPRFSYFSGRCYWFADWTATSTTHGRQYCRR